MKPAFLSPLRRGLKIKRHPSKGFWWAREHIVRALSVYSDSCFSSWASPTGDRLLSLFLDTDLVIWQLRVYKSGYTTR